MMNDEFWNRYDLLIKEFEEQNLTAIANHLKSARKLPNGLTDGWVEFIRSIKIAKQLWRSKFKDGNSQFLDDMISLLEINIRSVVESPNGRRNTNVDRLSTNSDKIA